MLTMAMSRSSADGVAIRFVLPVSWMTSRVHIMALWRVTCTRQNLTSITAEIPTKFCSTLKTRKFSYWVAHWSEVCYLRLLICFRACTTTRCGIMNVTVWFLTPTLSNWGPSFIIILSLTHSRGNSPSIPVIQISFHLNCVATLPW